MKGETEARRRIHLLDDAPPGTTPTSLMADLARLVHMLGAVANTHNPDVPMAEPAELDCIVQESQLLRRVVANLEASNSAVFASRQLWTGSVAINRIPSADSFQPPTVNKKPRVKPTRQGLYTSTSFPGSDANSMWLMYLEQFGGGLFPKPWCTYELAVSASSRIYDVGSADAWTRLVLQYPLEFEGLVYPDWMQIAARYDAVHFTIPAIVAMQEVRLIAGGTTIAEGYWDAEQTVWLKWSFDSVHAIATGDE